MSFTKDWKRNQKSTYFYPGDHLKNEGSDMDEAEELETVDA